MGKFLFCAKVSKIVMVGLDFEWGCMTFKVVTEGFECTDDCEEFFVMDVVIEFCRLE